MSIVIQYSHFRFWVRALSALLLCIGMGVTSITAQETSGALAGKITDTAGNSLSGATIVLVHQPSGTRYATTSGKGGFYHLSNLHVGGPYVLRVAYTGMHTVLREDIQISLGEAFNINLAMADESHQLTEVIVDAKKRRAADQYGSGVNISGTQLSAMPTIARSITDFTRMVPQGSKDNSFGGTNFRYNNVSIDGAINNDAIGFSPSLGGITGASGMPGSSTRTNPISLDAIEAMQVYLAPFDITLGNFTGGSINAVTKSGTNQFKGSVYSYGRNASLTGSDNAGDKSSIPSSFEDYQMGFHLGFPIIKNKLFFFTCEELTRRTDPALGGAGTPDNGGILSEQDAINIQQFVLNKYNFNIGTYGQFDAYARSNKFFNRLDWNINERNQLVIRNNTITSKAINLERDNEDFRFGSIAYQQVNNQTSTVMELKSHISSRFSNSFLLGYTSIHDYRNPSGDPSFPQVQIVGRTPGTTIYFGTDREAAVFNQRQKTIEITDNFMWYMGKHTFTFGTHNELYHIDYGFVNAWNGRVDYGSIEDFLAGNPSRVRANFNYSNNNRDYLFNHPAAKFNINLNSLYAQDEIRITRRFKLVPGFRLDDAWLPQTQVLSSKTQTAIQDRYYGSTYFYTPLNQIKNKYFNRIQASPRIGFSYDFFGDRKLVVRGGTGFFTGRVPFAWLGYAFYNNGDSFGAFDQKSSSTPYASGSDPLARTSGGIADFVKANGQDITSITNSKTQVDAVDNRLKMPKVWRSSLAVDYTTPDGTKITLEGVFTKTVRDIKFQQVNIIDAPAYYSYDSLTKKQPIFTKGNIDPRFANAYEMSNTSKGFRYSLTAQLSKKFSDGVQLMAAYTYGVSKDISNGIRNSMESNWQLNQSLTPNDPQLAYSNFDIRHRIIASFGYTVLWAHQHLRTTCNLFFNAQSGSPFTWGFVNQTIQRTPQQVSLAYIPYHTEAVNFFQPYTDKNGAIVTAHSQADLFNAFIDSYPYLKSRRGNFTERNADQTPWNVQADFHFAQEILLSQTGHSLALSFDIINLTNLLNSNWGWVYFVPNTFNSTASVGLTIPISPVANPVVNNYPIFTFQKPNKPYSVDYFNSRYQMQLGIRYSF